MNIDKLRVRNAISVAAVLLALITFPLRAQVRITEFMASNTRTLVDDFGQPEDWIELQNQGSNTVNLLDWALTDNTNKLAKWLFPSTNLPPGRYLIVFASNRDRRTPGQALHTNFKLDAAGEYLALVRPDGTIATEFSPAYPPQLPDVSYGFGLITTDTTLVARGATAQILVPATANGGSTLDYTWTGATTNEPFDASRWRSGPLGAGFSAGEPLVAVDAMKLRFNFDAAPVNNVILDSKPAGTLHPGTNLSAAWVANSTDTASAPVTRQGVMQFVAALTNQITLAADPDFNATNGTIMFWVRAAGVTGTGSEGAILFDRRTTTGDVIVLRNSGTIFVQARNAGGFVNSFESSAVITDDHWHHVAYAYDQGSAGFIAIYIDGVLNKSQNNGAAWSWPASQRIELGRSHDSYWRRFEGYLDDLRIYSRILSAIEIAQIDAGDGPVAPAEIQTDLRTDMYNVVASAFLRVPFVVDDPTNFALLRLNLKYDDGFVAWLNGLPAVEANAPVSLAWNAAATGPHSSAVEESFLIGNPGGSLVVGTNVLAIQGLNLSAQNPSFLINPELVGITVAAASTNATYFTTATPGELNSGGASSPGPIILEAQHMPNVPSDTDDLRVTARVLPAFFAVSNVLMNYRVMFGSEVAVPMNDSGSNGDLVAADGIWSALIPAGASAPGQMVRYYLVATDAQTNTSRWPLFTDPANSAQYLGTVITPGYVTSTLPVVHLFAPPSVLQPGPTTSQTGADSQTGSRVSLYFDGEFYDNIYMSLRGNSSAGWNKKSHRLEFNREHPFRHAQGGGRLRKTSFMADYPDPAYMRQGLALWLCGLAGTPALFYEPYRLQLNGAFYQLANHNMVLGEELLERVGYDPDGALYAAAGQITPGRASTGGFEMKTRTWDKVDAYAGADYYTLANGIAATLPTGQRATNLFDLLDLPEVIGYMAAARFAHENDDVWANMSVYHDNDGDDLWRIIPFDMNLSYGAAFMDQAVFSGIQVTNDNLKSFPLYGSSQAIPDGMANWNKLYDAIFSVPATREMFLRRLRTLLDTWVKPPGTSTNQLPIESRVLAWRDLIAADAAADRAWWGWPAKSGQCNFDPGIDLNNGVSILVTDFLENRRQHFYGKHSVTNAALPIGISKTQNAGIPLAQPLDAAVSIVGWDYDPVSGNQDEEYVCLTNANGFAVDISGWKLAGGITHQLQPGTVIPSRSALYLTPNARAFHNRVQPPHGGMGLFVQGGCSGHLSARGESLTLTDNLGRLVCSNAFAGTPSLAQQFLRITEIMYNPAPMAGVTNDAQSFEYVELKNISGNVTLDLTGVRFADGIAFSFTGSAVTNLAPGQRVLVVRDAGAFALRYGGSPLVAGQFAGALDNKGENLSLEDASGEKIVEFAYNNTWYRVTDGLGFSLVIVNELADWSSWGDKASWRPSGTLNGSPGSGDNALQVAPVLVNEVLAHTDLPEVDSIELYNPGSTVVSIGGWFLSDDFYTPKKFRIPDGTVIASNSYAVFTASQFGAGATGFLLSEYGESVYLLSGDAATNLTGYAHGFDFAASPNGVSFGRYVDSQTNEQFVLQRAPTLGSNNAGPRVGPLVISEIMYRPPNLAGGADDDLDEFIEVQNIAVTNVPLYCVYTSEPGYGAAALTNTWRLRDAVDYDFPTNATLAPNSRLLVVGFDPVTNATQLAAFRALYGVGTGVPIYGPWQGKLDNSADTIELKAPDRPDVTGTNVVVPYVLVDKVAYTDTAPWPTNADGRGDSLQRRALSGFGNDPTNWAAAGVTAGHPNALNFAPAVTLLSPANASMVCRTPPITLSATATDSDGTIAAVEFWDGPDKLATRTAPPFSWSWTNAPLGVHELTARAVDNLGSARASIPTTIMVLSLPPSLAFSAPADGAFAVVDTEVPLAVTAFDSDTTIVAVDFYLDGVPLGSSVTPPYTWTWTASGMGNHVLSAVARDEYSYSGPATVSIAVTPRLGDFMDAFAARGQCRTFTNFVTGDNSTYTGEAGEPSPPAGTTAHSAWLSWVAPASGACTMDTIGSSFDTVLVIYTNNPSTPQALTNLAVVAANDDISASVTQSQVTFNAVSNVTYQVAVYGHSAADCGRIAFHQSLQAPPFASVVFQTNAAWRYLDKGTNLGTAWIPPAYADNTWSNGLGKFGFNTSSGNAGFNTVLSYGPASTNKYITYYFRKPFVLSSLAGATNLLLEYQRDDGVAFYLNGADLHRNNLPTGTLAYAQLATNATDNGATWFSYLLPTNKLVVGTNVLAAEVHQSSVGSSDLVFDSRLTLLGILQPPVISVQPQGRSVPAGGSVSLSLAASGTAPITYQWCLNGVSLPGATATSYAITNAQPATAGSYTVMVNNPAGLVISTPALLTLVNRTPIQAALSRQDQSFTLTWSGGLAPYQVEVATNLADPNWQSVGGATTNYSAVLTPAFEKSFYRVRGQ